jgi:hypothetical protein
MEPSNLSNLATPIVQNIETYIYFLATEFNEPINDEKYCGLCLDATTT